MLDCPSKSASDRSPESPGQSGESVEVSSGLAPVLVLDVLARRVRWLVVRLALVMSARAGTEMSEGFPEKVSSCRAVPLKSGRAKYGEFCMDNIEHGPELVMALGVARHAGG